MARRLILMLGVMALLLTALGFVKFRQIESAVHAAGFQPPPEAVTSIVAQREQWPAVPALNYIDEDIDPRLREEISNHLRGCRRCSVLLDSTRQDSSGCRRRARVRNSARVWREVTSIPGQEGRYGLMYLFTRHWVIVPDLQPRLRIESELGRRGEGFHDLMNGMGVREITAETPRHDHSLHKLSIEEISNVIRACVARIVDLIRDKRMRCVLVF